jgi:hypothetical protein
VSSSSIRDRDAVRVDPGARPETLKGGSRVTVPRVADGELIRFFRAIGARDRSQALQLLSANPELAGASLAKDSKHGSSEEFFLAECQAQIYRGATALHVAAFAYDREMSQLLVEAGARERATDRRGGQPLHAAVNGVPGSSHWNPQEQVAVIAYLLELGADPNAVALGGVTPLHRAVRNRCSAAVRTLLDAGADPHQSNDSGSTAFSLANWTTGRGGSGSPEAKAEQELIARMLGSD